MWTPAWRGWPPTCVPVPCPAAHSSPADLADRLAAQGLRIDTDGVCMCLDLAGYAPAPPAGDEIAVVAVTDADQLAVWSAIVNAALFGGELIRADQFADLLPLPGVHFYLGLYGGTPVTTCMTIHRGDTAVLEMVSTLAAYRRRGVVGAAICRALADLCALGVETISLRAEMDAVSLYRRLGFRDCFPRVVASVP
jgi:ribosomal protein S18 acetylase RimI-like enzyme